MTTDATSAALLELPMSPEPWWKKALEGPPPRWASPAAVERLKQEKARVGTTHS